MEFLHFIFLCSVLITTSLAEEETTQSPVQEFKNLTVLEPQQSCQKREKQYLMEDEPCDETELKRDERQSTPTKNRDSKIINIRLLPKKGPVTIKQIQPPGLSKPVNVYVNNKPKIIPTKIPVILKTKVVPSPAQVMRMKALHDAVNNKENHLPANETEPEIVPNDNNPNNISYVIEPRSETHELDEGNDNRNDTFHMDDPDIHEEITDNNETDEPEPLPAVKKRRPITRSDEDDEIPLKKSKHIPLAKSKKPKKNHSTEDDDLDTDDDPDFIQITNGTHIISIKKIPLDTRKGEDNISHDSSEDYDVPEIEHRGRIMNEPNDGNTNKDKPSCITITKHNYEEFEEKAPTPQLQSPAVQVATLPIGSQDPWNYLQSPPNFNNPYYQNVYDNCLPTRMAPIIQFPDNSNRYSVTPDNSPNGNSYSSSPDNSIIYFPNDVSSSPYNPEMDQYITPNSVNADTNQYMTPNTLNPEINQYMTPNTQNPETNQYMTQNTVNPETDNVLYQIPRLEALDRIWRAWKDVEIKIRNAHKYEDPLVIDIRRTVADHNDLNKGDNVSGKGHIPSVPIHLNNQNNGNHYPYVKSNHRHTS
ncbi:rho GTPase-activating protein gacU isoform X2 [Helicoverpa armigera]|uniref:rho GTPase-activating protein gacU isoform X2 n=1 Tax=Helicoverpa armigera TaxID=29058 RepID=UPI003082F04A